MADNVRLNRGVNGELAASDNVDGVQYQRVKLTLGADGVNDGDVSAANPVPVSVADSANLDAFSRLRVSEPVGLFAVQNTYELEPFLIESGNTGTGTTAPAHNADSRMVVFSASAGTGTEYVQSFEYIPYQPGKSQLALITGLMGAAVAGAVVDVGIFDASNGVIYRQDGVNGLEIIRRTSTSGSTVDNKVPQSQWNIDPLNGTGPSGITIDPETVFILVIDAQFLAMGRVRVGFDINGVIIYVHEFLNANDLVLPYMQTLTLPVQMLLETTATATAKSCAFKCASVISEGGFADDAGSTFGTPALLTTAANGVRTASLSIRPKTTFNGLANRTYTRLDSIELLITGVDPVFWELCIDSTFSVAPTFADINATHSSNQYSSAAGTLTTAGTVIASGLIGSGRQSTTAAQKRIASRYPITLDRAGAARARGTYTLVLTGLGGASATYASFNLTEIR